MMDYVSVVRLLSMIEIITSLQNQQVKQWGLLHHTKERNLQRKFLVEGWHLVEMAFNAGLLDLILVIEQNHQYADVRQIIVSQSVMNKLSLNQSENAIIGVCRMAECDFEWTYGNYLMLDGVQDPGNVGTILRTARAFGIRKIIMSQDSVDLYNDKLIKATQGACFSMDIYRGDLLEAINQLKALNIPLLVSDLNADLALDDLPLVDAFALVVGNEGQGIREQVRQLSDFRFKIPMDNFDSLNVAVATGICIYSLIKREG